MQPDNEANPKKEEILTQLEHMIKSNIFSARPRQAQILEFIVKRALEGKETADKDIRKEFFPTPPYKPDSTSARTNINYIRRHIDEYYGSIGAEDLVVISLPRDKSLHPTGRKKIKLPPGKSYQPVFSYNSHHEHLCKCKIAQSYLIRNNPGDLKTAQMMFSRLGGNQPYHARAYIGMAEAKLLRGWIAWELDDFGWTAVSAAFRAVHLDPTNWHAFAALGAAALVRHDLQIATLAFDNALQRSKRETQLYVWYHIFLLATGKSQEAFKLAWQRYAEYIGDPYAQSVYALFLYLGRRFDEAQKVAFQAMQLSNWHCWLANLAFSLAKISSGEDGIVSSLSKIEKVLGRREHDFLFPGLAALARALDARKETQSSQHQHGSSRSLYRKLYRIAERLANQDMKCWSQLALLSMATNDFEGAINSLDKACDALEPVILVANHLPLFDPLRQHKQFQRMVDRRFKPIRRRIAQRPAGYGAAASRRRWLFDHLAPRQFIALRPEILDYFGAKDSTDS